MWIDSFKVKVDSSENNKLLNDTEFVLHRITLDDPGNLVSVGIN